MVTVLRKEGTEYQDLLQDTVPSMLATPSPCTLNANFMLHHLNNNKKK